MCCVLPISNSGEPFRVSSVISSWRCKVDFLPKDQGDRHLFMQLKHETKGNIFMANSLFREQSWGRFWGAVGCRCGEHKA